MGRPTFDPSPLGRRPAKGPSILGLFARGSPGSGGIPWAPPLVAILLVAAGILAFGVQVAFAQVATATATATVPATATSTATTTATSTPTATATSTATSTPTATATAAATATPTATATAAATATPTATATSTASATSTPSTTSTPAATPTATATATPTATTAAATATATATPTGASSPPNDDFDAATAIAALPYSAVQDTTFATSAGDDPDMGAGFGANSNTVWYRFVAPSAGSVRAHTFGSSYDTILAAFTGARGSLARVAGNDDAGSLQSEILFDVQAGATYHLEVAGLEGGGRLNLAVTFTPSAPAAPANDDFGAATLISAFPFDAALDTTLATVAADDPNMGAGAGVNSNTVWYRFTAQQAGLVRARTHGSGYDTVLAAFAGSRGALALVAANDDSGSLQSEVTFDVQPGQTYYLEAARYGAPGGGQLRLRVEFSVAASPPTPTAVPGAPPNDDFDAATAIGYFPYSATQDTSAATVAADDPNMGAGFGVNLATVWYRFVAPSAGSVRASTSGSGFDTLLAAFTGSRGALVLAASNDDSGTLQSEVEFDVLAGSEYHLEAAGLDGGGQLRLSVEFTSDVPVAPANDEFDRATAIGALPFTTVQDTSLATTAAYDPPMGAGSGANSNTVWYRLVAPAGGSVRADTFGSGYDTVLAAFTGTRAALSLLAGNDDSGSRQSEIAFDVQAGATYHLEVAQYGSPGGGYLRMSVRFSGVSLTPSPTPTATTAPTSVPTAIPAPAGPSDQGSGGGGGGGGGSSGPPASTAVPAAPTTAPTAGERPEAAETPRPEERREPRATLMVLPTLGPTVEVKRVTGPLPTGIPTVSGSGVVALLEPTPGVGVVSAGALEVQVHNTEGQPLAVRMEPMAGPPAGAEVPPGATVLRTFALDVYDYSEASNRAEKDTETRVVVRAELSQADLAALPRDANGNPDTSSLVFLRVLPEGGVVEIPTTWVANPNPPPAGWAAAVFVPRSVYLLAVRPAGQQSLRVVPADARYFRQTGYRVNEDRFWDYFQKRGGVTTFGYPISREFTLMGFPVQMFQRGILQLMPDGGVATMNLLDEGLMPYTRVNFSAFPKAELELIQTAPSAAEPGYGEKAIAFLRANVPDEWEGMQVDFLRTFLGTVRSEDAFPMGDGDEGLLPLLNLELWGLPTSRPAFDPNNRNFVYQRFQRGIMHYDAATGATQGLLLADYLKGIMTGKDLPADLAEQARGSRFYRQYDRTRPGQVARTWELGGTDLRDAFEPEVPREVVASAHAASALLAGASILGAMILAVGLRTSRRSRGR